MKDWVREDLISKEARSSAKAMLTLMPMGVTSENVAEKFGISREQQDLMAFESHQKAAKAQENGWFKGTQCLIQTKS
jgi:acetyl-CoA acetyltransferase